MKRPVFQNEISGDINGDASPRYKMQSQDSTFNVDNVSIVYQNPITQQGTPINAENMNNMFDFDNLESMAGNNSRTLFNQSDNDGILEEIYAAGTPNIVNARRLTNFLPNGNITETTTIYSDDGIGILRQTIKTTSFDGDIITEEVI